VDNEPARLLSCNAPTIVLRERQCQGVGRAVLPEHSRAVLQHCGDVGCRNRVGSRQVGHGAPELERGGAQGGRLVMSSLTLAGVLVVALVFKACS
jgi:hypothetical protein